MHGSFAGEFRVTLRVDTRRGRRRVGVLFALQLISWNGKFKEFVCEEFPDSSFDEALPGFDTPFRELEIDLEEIPCAGDEGVSRAEQSGETPPSPGVSGLAGVSPGA